MPLDSAPANDSGPVGAAAPPRRNFLVRYLARFDDGEVLRWAFRGLLIGAIGVLALDLNELYRENGGLFPQAPADEIVDPMLPPAVDGDNAMPPGIDPRPFLTTGEKLLRNPIVFSLEKGGVLAATGSIDPGAAARFADEIDARGEYVRTISFDSPGGSLDDAMAMAKLIRSRGLATEVTDGALCASSCPLVFAGGATRSAGPKAAIGVHQFYAVAAGERRPGPDQAMSDAQATTARISRHLAEMGVDPALWLHALDTPPRSLYYLSPEELARYKLTTDGAGVAKKIK